MNVLRCWAASTCREPWAWLIVSLILAGSLGCASAGRIESQQGPSAQAPGADDTASSASTQSASTELASTGGYDLPAAPADSRSTLVMAINDVYRIAGLEEGEDGGLARVRTLRRELEREAPDLLVLHAGDALFPSFMSRTYDGKQMVDVLNLLDGRDDDSLDERMFATFGNHEFDESKMSEAAIVDARVEESRFRWLSANLDFKKGADGKPLVEAPNLLPWALVESGGIQVGIFGLIEESLANAEYLEVRDAVAAAREATATLRAKGAEVVIGLTHQFVEADCSLLSTLGEDGPDLVLGGHEHAVQRWRAGDRWLLKADADARSATVVRISIDSAGKVLVEPAERVGLSGDSPPADPLVDARVQEWRARHDTQYCASHNQESGCLAEAVGFARTLLVAEETAIRSEETSLGNWLTDLMLAAFRDQGAQVAFANSGSLRLNQDIQPGPISLADVEGIFQYSMKLRLLEIDGKTLQEVVNRSVEQWPGAGHWLQISGFGFHHDSEKGTATELVLWTPEGKRPVEPGERILAVTGDYLVNPRPDADGKPTSDQDGYTMLNPSQVVAEAGDLKRIVLAALAAVGEAGIAPQAEGRITASADDSADSGGVQLCPNVE